MRFGKHVAVVLGLLLVAAPSFAGIGIHVNMDQTTIEAANNSFSFPGESQSVSLNRTESGSPIGAGVDLTLNILPIFDFQVSVEAAFATYDVEYDAPEIPGQPSQDTSKDGIPYARIGADLTALYNVFKMPVGRVFVGGGLSAGVLAPVVSETLILDNLSSSSDELDPTELASTEFKFGFHIIAGVGIKPPVFPLGARVYIKHYIMSGVDEPAPSSWTTLGLGVYLGG